MLKAEGAGNDFLVGWDEWAERLAGEPELVARLCHRRFGLGADGTLALERIGADRVRLTYRNADGSLAAFCANGTRCAARVAVERLGIEPRLVVDTGWGEIAAEVAGVEVTLQLPPPSGPPRRLVLEAGGRRWEGWSLVLGVPHLLLLDQPVEALDLGAVAPELRHHPALSAEGANVSFVGEEADGSAPIRSWERGVEGETLCCGSAVAAAGLVLMARRGTAEARFVARSGDLLVVTAVGQPPLGGCRLSGPARLVAEVEPSAELLTEDSGSTRRARRRR